MGSKSLLGSWLEILFTVLYKVVYINFEYVGEIYKCDHSNESYTGVISSGSVCHFAQSVFNLIFYDIFIVWLLKYNQIINT